MKKLIFLIVILGLGYLAYSYLVPKTGDEGGVLQNNNQESTSNIPANWKTFTSSEDKFSLRYPPTWEIKKVEDGIYVVTTEPGERPEEAPMSIDMTGSLPYVRAVEEIQKNLASPKQVSLRISGLKGVEISGNVLGETAEGSQYSIFTMLDDAGRLISLDYGEQGMSDEEMRAIYRLMVSSLTFTKASI